MLIFGEITCPTIIPATNSLFPGFPLPVLFLVDSELIIFPVLFKELLGLVFYFKASTVFFKIPTGNIYPPQTLVTFLFSVPTQRPELPY